MDGNLDKLVNTHKQNENRNPRPYRDLRGPQLLPAAESPAAAAAPDGDQVIDPPRSAAWFSTTEINS